MMQKQVLNLLLNGIGEIQSYKLQGKSEQIKTESRLPRIDLNNVF